MLTLRLGEGGPTCFTEHRQESRCVQNAREPPTFFVTSSPAVGGKKWQAQARRRRQDAAPTNPRGIPYAPFVDQVEDYVATRQDVEATLQSFQEMISKYQFMEMNLQRRMAGLKDKLPDIQKTLDAVRFLKARKDESDPIETTFEFNDTLYAQAKIPPTDEVYIWLGANVMLSYPIDEAETLLNSKFKTAKSSLSNCEEDVDFLREQITTMEVAIARVYNWEVVQKRKEKASEEEEAKAKKKDGEASPDD
ncbi:hypothetical protein L249_7615 [Ophiocordyceps polyrhachis-furcata BCC 54312]|uniref:Prefoldin subunit 3 n=1 Tax=Ophiocordyceps polyrhachis-furcata BCC 54312 TaxID=1330021 RepID=A0A367LBD2_9HYPO|nr:hypothetical protein L249_7615 [Ophiocordyceps polyrhachis-furcata BCC 54312]